MNEYIRILDNNSSNTSNNDSINFNEAITAEDENAYTLSGSKRLLDFLRSKLGDKISMIIDFSVIPSSLKNEQHLADFITVYDPADIFTHNLEVAYNFVYPKLKETNKGLFYHPNFFKDAQYPSFYYSTDLDPNNAEIRKKVSIIDSNHKFFPQKNSKDWKEVDGMNSRIRFKNVSFPVSFREYEKMAREKIEKDDTCLSRNQILRQLYHLRFCNPQAKNLASYLLSIPLIGYSGKTVKRERDNSVFPYGGMGAIFVFFLKDKNGKTPDEAFIKSIANDLWFLGLQITYNSIFQIAYEQSRGARKQAIKAAKAAIMSRNMSHNLGSHVMSYIKMHLGSVSNIIRDNALSTLLEDGNLDSLRNRSLDAKKLTLPFLVGIGRFISYLQERQDFIATISTDYIPYYSTVNFKDFIYDELNCDKRFERQSQRTNLKPDNILLGNLARSEGLARHTAPTSIGSNNLKDIVLKFRSTFDGSPVQEAEFRIGSGEIKMVDPRQHYGDKLDLAIKELDEMRHYELSLPGGVIGRQAIFSILENVIRNAAKHGNWQEKGQLEFTMDIFTKEDIENKCPSDDLKTRLRDDDQAVPDSLSLKKVLETFFYDEGQGADDYLFFTLTDNLSCSSHSLKALRKALIEGYIDECGQTINTNKGIKEMRISAAWLRSISNDTRHSPFNKENINIEGEKSWPKNGYRLNKIPPILYARRSKDRDGLECHLQYIFCVMRDKKVAFVSPAFTESYHRNGWSFVSPRIYLQSTNKNFELVLYDDIVNNCDEKLNESTFEEVRRYSSIRFFKLSDLINKGAIGFNNIKTDRQHCKPDDLNNAYTQLHLKLVESNASDNIYIIDESTFNNNGIVQTQSNQSPEPVMNRYYRIEVQPSLPPNSMMKYRYQYHLEDKDQFEMYVIKKDPERKNTKFCEGISGDNSTDRLVRNEYLSELWFFKHLHAMQQEVAIFDERIFTKVSGLDKSHFISNESSFFGHDLNDYKEYLRRIYTDEVDQLWINYINDVDSLRNFLKNKNFEMPSISDRSEVDALHHLGATFIYKNLYVFTLIRSNVNPNRFNLYGFDIDKDKPAFSICVKYATLSWDNSQKKLSIENKRDPKTFQMKFHSLSIHQGLLDKLYNAFDIAKDDIQAKENLTKDLYKYFIIDATKQEISFKEKGDIQHYFLPGMTIHSGRSKPCEEDMPQQLPFIPYSALEHAVLDCKYSIVQLLDSAHYE